MPSLSRRAFCGAVASAAVAAQQQARRPNLLLILADDMGYSDAGCFGGEIETPNLDSLAANGVRFTQAYSTARCMPSRGCLMTGFHSQQTGMEQGSQAKPPAWVKFLPQYLGPQGYRSYHAGKWHVAGSMPLRDTGFHRSYYLADQDRFFSPTRHFLDDQPLPAVKPTEGFYATNAITDRALGFLADHRKNHTAAPFFLYLAYTAPHFPLHALEEDIRRYKEQYLAGWDTVRQRRWERVHAMGLVKTRLAPLEPEVFTPWNTPDAELKSKIGPGEVTRAVPWKSLTPQQREFQATKMAIHAAMVHRMDAGIGRVLEELRDMQELDNTAIVFLSDNGASAEQLIRADGHDAKAAPGSWASHLCLGPGWASAANSPFRRSKSFVHEGGIASPMIVHWPAGFFARGELRRTPCHFVDMLPTLAAIAGVSEPRAHAGAPPLPGKSLVPAFRQDRAIPKDYLFFHHSNNRALRKADYKLVSAGKDGPWELYHLATDRGETNNLAAKEPERVEAMSAEWKRLQDEFLAQSRS